MRSLIAALLVVVFTSTLTTVAGAESIFCELIDRPYSSELRLDYTGEDVSEVFLRSPGDNVYRPLPVTINMVVKKSDTQGRSEAVLVKPIPPKDIDWEKVGQCYLETGTTWYFEFSYIQDTYQVQFVPFFAVQSPRCVTPRVKPQTHRLGCRLEN